MGCGAFLRAGVYGCECRTMLRSCVRASFFLHACVLCMHVRESVRVRMWVYAYKYKGVPITSPLDWIVLAPWHLPFVARNDI